MKSLNKQLLLALGILWIISKYIPYLKFNNYTFLIYIINIVMILAGIAFVVEIMYHPRIDKCKDGVFLWYGNLYRRSIKIK